MDLRDQVMSSDGRLVDLVVMPLGRDVELVATRPDGQTSVVKFHLAKLQPCNGGTPC